MKPAHLLFVMVINLIWATNVVSLKEMVDSVGPLTGVFLRYLLVLICTLPWLRLVPGRMVDIIVVGVISGALFMGLGGLSFALADNIGALAIAAQLGVPFSLLLAVLFLGERMRWPRILATLAAFLGVAIMVFDPAIWNERIALALTIVGAVAYAVGSLLYRRLAGVSVLTIHGWLALVSTPILFIAVLIFEPGFTARVRGADPVLWFWLAYAAIGASIVGHAGMSWLLQRYPVTVVAPMTLPTPLISVVVTILVYDTPISFEFVLGALVTFAGVAVITWRSATQREGETLVKEWTRKVKQ